MINKRLMAFSAFTCLVILGLGAVCSPRTPTGTLRVLITDKPYPFEHISEAIVTVVRVEVRQGEEEGGDDDDAFITVFEDQTGKPFDLLELQNGQTDLLAEAEVPVGEYTQMRLVISSGQIKLTNEATFDLTVPSGASSGLKLNATFEVAEGQTTELLMDFDLSRAFDVIPGSAVDSIDEIQEFRFSPTLHGAIRVVQASEVGQISGAVTDAATTGPIASASVTAYDGTDTEISSTSTEADGTYILSGLPPGTYRVEFSASGYQDAEAADVAVTAGQTTENVDVALAAEVVGP